MIIVQSMPMPNIFTEFGSYTVGESMAHIYSVISEKRQNDRECWYMIDSSFITTLPDTWGIGEKFLLVFECAGEDFLFHAFRKRHPSLLVITVDVFRK